MARSCYAVGGCWFISYIRKYISMCTIFDELQRTYTTCVLYYNKYLFTILQHYIRRRFEITENVKILLPLVQKARFIARLKFFFFCSKKKSVEAGRKSVGKYLFSSVRLGGQKWTWKCREHRAPKLYNLKPKFSLFGRLCLAKMKILVRWYANFVFGRTFTS